MVEPAPNLATLDLSTLVVDFLRVPADDAVLDAELVTAAAEHQRSIEVEGPAQRDDALVVDYVVTANGEEIVRDNCALRLGTEGLMTRFASWNDEVADALVGARAGETREMTVAMPQRRFFDKRLSGALVRFTITVRKIQRRDDTNPIDDALAARCGFENLAAMKADLRKRQVARHVEPSSALFRWRVAKALADLAHIEPSEDEVREEVQRLLEEDRERSPTSKHMIAARGRAKHRKVIAAFAQLHKLEVTDDEILEDKVLAIVLPKITWPARSVSESELEAAVAEARTEGMPMPSA